MSGLRMLIMPDGSLSILVRDGHGFHYVRNMEATAAAFTQNLDLRAYQRCQKY